MLAMMLTSPVLSRAEIPMMIKIGLAGSLSFIFFDEVIHSSNNLIPTNPWLLSIVIFYEILIGAILGMLINLLFDGIATFAHLAGVQMGGSASNIFEPSLNTGANPIAFFYLYISLTLFLLCGGFFNIAEILSRSFSILPLGSLGFNYAGLATNYLGIFSALFLAAFKLMLPLLVVLTVADIFVALVAKVLPQANIYFLIMPNKLILGMIVISMTLAGLSAGIQDFVSEGIFDNYSQLFS